MKHAVVTILKLYQATLSLDHGWLGRVIPHQRVCRYHPTCSEYAVVSIERFGLIKGGRLALRRISRCHPFGGYGLDPVPEK